MKRIDTNKIISQSFDDDFHSHLDFRLTNVFFNTHDPILKKIWYDGITEFTFPGNKPKTINPNDLKQIQAVAWIGTDGEDEYEMTFILGKKSHERIIKGKSLYSCVPDEKNGSWFTLDIENKKIEIRLK